MKSFRRAVIATMLAVAPVMAVGTAWANTELVPGSRLVAPYWDIKDDRSTLMFIVNASRRANLQENSSLSSVCGLRGVTTSPTPGTTVPSNSCAVHLEFYNKACDNVNLTIDLSKQDIDQLDILTDSDLGTVKNLGTQGFMDADVRRDITGSGHTNPSVQANVLMGTVLLTDSGSDFAVAYPMASSQGSANGGIGGDIVTRDNQGDADVWSGGFETFPARVYVPMYFAEGANYNLNFTSTLAIAGPAQSLAGGEAPGQDLEDDPNTQGIDESILIDAEVDVVDACENAQSDDLREHYVLGTLQEVFTSDVTAAFNGTGTIGTCITPSGDVDRKAANYFQGGFIDITNNAPAHSYSGGVDSNNVNIESERGLVGVLVQNTATTGDATRLWGDCSFPNGNTEDANGTAAGIPNLSSGACRTSFTLVDKVSHADLLP